MSEADVRRLRDLEARDRRVRTGISERPAAKLWLPRTVGVLLLTTAAYAALEGWR